MLQQTHGPEAGTVFFTGVDRPKVAMKARDHLWIARQTQRSGPHHSSVDVSANTVHIDLASDADMVAVEW